MARPKSSRFLPTRSDLLSAAAVAILVFGGTTYLLSPAAHGLEVDPADRAKRQIDHHYAGCDTARANGHENIAAGEPSYREWMDGDGDGLASEPIRR